MKRSQLNSTLLKRLIFASFFDCGLYFVYINVFWISEYKLYQIYTCDIIWCRYCILMMIGNESAAICCHKCYKGYTEIYISVSEIAWCLYVALYLPHMLVSQPLFPDPSFDMKRCNSSFDLYLNQKFRSTL